MGRSIYVVIHVDRGRAPETRLFDNPRLDHVASRSMGEAGRTSARLSLSMRLELIDPLHHIDYDFLYLRDKCCVP